MQDLWARILAGEANTPGKFSKRTVNLLADLDKVDAESFVKLISFGVTVRKLVPLIYDFEQDIYRNNGVTFNSLSHLESIGLIHLDASNGYTQGLLRKREYVEYYGARIWVSFPGNAMNIGHVMLTKTGQELASICESRPCKGFVKYLREVWKGFGYRVDKTVEQDDRVEPAQFAAQSDPGGLRVAESHARRDAKGGGSYSPPG